MGRLPNLYFVFLHQRTFKDSISKQSQRDRGARGTALYSMVSIARWISKWVLHSFFAPGADLRRPSRTGTEPAGPGLYSRQAEFRMMLQKLARLNFGSSNASTSSFIVSPGGFGFVAESIFKGMDDLLLEVVPARMCLDDGLALSIGYIKVANTQDVHVYSGCQPEWR
jgi:hypothetical protein